MPRPLPRVPRCTSASSCGSRRGPGALRARMVCSGNPWRRVPTSAHKATRQPARVSAHDRHHDVRDDDVWWILRHAAPRPGTTPPQRAGVHERPLSAQRRCGTKMPRRCANRAQLVPPAGSRPSAITRGLARRHPSGRHDGPHRADRLANHDHRDFSRLSNSRADRAQKHAGKSAAPTTTDHYQLSAFGLVKQPPGRLVAEQ